MSEQQTNIHNLILKIISYFPQVFWWGLVADTFGWWIDGGGNECVALSFLFLDFYEKKDRSLIFII